MKKKKKKICVISEIKKDWEIWASVFAFILVICVLVLLLTSFTEEMIDRPVKSGSGKMVHKEHNELFILRPLCIICIL